jgi:periplasmic protein TonB
MAASFATTVFMPTPLSVTDPQPRTPHSPAPRHLSRNASLALAVVALHVGGLYALQSGLLRRAAEVLVPVELLAQIVEPTPQPVAPPPPPPAPPPPKAKPQPVAPKPQPTPRPTPLPPPPMPLAVPDAEPSPKAVTGAATPQPPAPPIAAPVSVAPPVPLAPPAPPAPPRIQLPDSNADYLANRAPPYPPLSKRLGEQGKVVIRVFIDTAGNATQAEVRTSSGYDRLDQTALKTVQTWKYRPGKVNGEPKAMWFNVPIHFVLE